MNATTFILAALSPLLVAWIRQRTWPGEVVTLVSMLVVVVLWTIGQAFDGALAWPLTADYWIGLGAAWAAQQAVYKLFIPNETIQRLEDFGTPDGARRLQDIRERQP